MYRNDSMEKLKTIFVLYKRDDWKDKLPLEQSPETRMSFEEFYTLAAERSVRVYRASIDWYDEKSSSFTKAWTFENGKWRKIKRPPKPDALFDKIAGKYDFALFDKKMKMAEQSIFVNSPTFRALFDNKLNQYLVFEKWMPLSYLAENTAQLAVTFKKIKSEKAVVKLLYGSGGKEVAIDTKTALLKKKFTFPVLVQSFVPTAGVPGFSPKKEVADLRLVFIDHKLVYALSRIAKRSSLFTNFHQGAKAVLVPNHKIPKSCLKMSKEIQSQLSHFERTHYSLDFMFTTQGKPLFIEINTTPGFDLLRLVGPETLRRKHAEALLALFF